MKKFNLIKTILSITSLLVCATLLIISIFAWYAVNKTANVNNAMGVTAGNERIHFTENLIAKKYSIDGTVTKNTYSTASGTLVLTKSEVYTIEPITTQTFITDGSLYILVNDEMIPVTSGTFNPEEKYYELNVITSFTNTDFRFLYMLPRERIDITVGYYMDLDCDNESYFLKLNDMTGGSFTVDGKTHYSTGAFKYKAVSLKDESGNNALGFTPDSDYTFLNSYDISKDDTEFSEMRLYNHVWDNDYENLYFTFSLAEDFSQYYDLVSHAEETVGRLLSNLTFNIGSIFLQLS